MTADPFDTVGPSIPRDRWKRPLITPRGGGEPVPYTRASTYAGALDDGHALGQYLKRHTAIGIARNEDLAAMAAPLPYGDPKLDEIIETAMDRAGANGKANHGTAMHLLTDPGANPMHTCERMVADVAAYHKTMARYGIAVSDPETFVVCDELKVAGTFDGIYDVPGWGRMIGDKKTGKLKAHTWAVQCAVYSRGHRYDPATAERVPTGVRQDVALVVHIPAGAGICELYLLDITAGWAAAQLAVKVRAWRATDDLLSPLHPGQMPPAPVVAQSHEELRYLIAEAPNPDALNTLYAAHYGVWHDELTALVKARLAFLG
jgi:hypothetical protein